MKNTQKGSATVAIIVILVILIIAGGAYFIWQQQQEANAQIGAFNNQFSSSSISSTTASSTVSQSDIARYNEFVAQRKANELTNPPEGFLVPNDIPTGYVLSDSYFSSSTTYWNYAEKLADQYNRLVNLSFSEGSSQTYNDYVTTETKQIPNSNEIIKAIDNFIYNGSNGTILGVYASQVALTYSTSTTEYFLAYNDNGKLLVIHTDDGTDITPAVLITLLKEMTPAR